MPHSSKPLLLSILFVFFWTICHPFSSARAQDAVVRAVLFYSPTCPHCHQVIQETLPPLLEKYGAQLEIVGVDISTQGGSVLFGAAIEQFAIPPEEQGVPMLFVGDTILVGSLEIPDRFPGLIEDYLAQGGIDLPDIPGLQEALASAQSENTETPSPTAYSIPGSQESVEAESLKPVPSPALEATAQPSPTALVSGLTLPDNSPPGLAERLVQDPVGNVFAIIVLIGMLLSIAGSIIFLRTVESLATFVRPSIWIPVLCLAGMVVAGYLAYVETAQVEAICGPVGDCNTVQQSKYAFLFDVLPIGVLGLAGYAFILVAWIAGRFGSHRYARLGSLALLGMTLFGVLFSMYLTFLEPFVIGATCAWCLSSAVIMTALLWLSVVPGKQALLKLSQF